MQGMHGKGKSGFAITVLFLVLAALAVFSFFLVRKKIAESYPWLPHYLKRELSPDPVKKYEGTKHIMFVFADHWEPHDDTDVARWAAEYPRFASAHRDADGVPPQHTFFWMFFRADEKKSIEYLQTLAGLSFQGLGEVEKHLHHDRDTGTGFVQKMNAAQGLANMTGANITAEQNPRKTFGFLHGRWALDNSRGDKACHVNNELILLRELGCYADFTHPSWGRMHPKIVNEFYYATDDPDRPKSYDTGIPMKVGKPGVGDLFLFTGQSVVHFEGLKPVYDHGEVDENNLPTPKRIDAWVDQGVHVGGRPEWIFIKVFSHGCVKSTMPVVLGEWRHKMHSYLEEKYNDGDHYVLHYVTAREGYNIAKAAEAGKTGNPNEYRDYLIAPYVNRFFTASVPYDTISFSNGQGVMRFHGKAGDEVTAHIRAHNVQVSGGAALVSSEQKPDHTVMKLKLTGTGVAGFTFSGLMTEMIEMVPPSSDKKAAA